MAKLKSRNTPSHTRWMVSTIFWITNAATFRLTLSVQDWIDPMQPNSIKNVLSANFIFPGLIVLILMLRDHWKDGKVHTAYVLVMLVNLLSAAMLLYLNDIEGVRSFLTTVLL